MGLQNSYDICLAQQQHRGLYDLLMFLIYLFLTISFSPIISTGPIFAKF